VLRTPRRSPDSTQIVFYLWGYLKDSAYITKPATLQELRHETEQCCLVIPADILVNVCHVLIVRRCQQYLEVNGGHFEHLRVFPMCQKPLLLQTPIIDLLRIM
jgi:hypothetical protein